MTDPIPGQTRRQSRVEAARNARTITDLHAAHLMLQAMVELDQPRVDFRRVAEALCEGLDEWTDEQLNNFDKRMDRYTDHLANVGAAISVVLEDRKAARLDTLPTMIPAGQKPWPAFPSDPEGNGWDDIDTTCEGGAR